MTVARFGETVSGGWYRLTRYVVQRVVPSPLLVVSSQQPINLEQRNIQTVANVISEDRSRISVFRMEKSLLAMLINSAVRSSTRTLFTILFCS